MYLVQILESASPRTKVRGLKRGAFWISHFVTQKGRKPFVQKAKAFLHKKPEPTIHPRLKRRGFLAF